MAPPYSSTVEIAAVESGSLEEQSAISYPLLSFPVSLDTSRRKLLTKVFI